MRSAGSFAPFGRGCAAAARCLLAVVLAAPFFACATVRPEQRAILADPVMQFPADERDERARAHVLEYREGATGGGAIRGGGCGCN
ncbi:MAG TPA: DUF4266 domain-containing protein [Polyangiaceae bacterium]|nr:DUF4266 domain-containing protein [Polyangiaceae bacterium]